MTTSTVFVHTLNAGKGKWSRYEFPFLVEFFAQLGNRLYIRSGDDIHVVDADSLSDDVEGSPVNFSATVQWPWLDFGAPGVSKQLQGFDLVASGTPSVSIGYDQRSTSTFTTPYLVDADTLPGGPVLLPVLAPTFSLKLTFAAGTDWSVQSATLYFNDLPGKP